MPVQTLDCKGMKCPQPLMKVAAMAPRISKGDVLEVLADCTSFPDDIKKWCTSNGKVLLGISDLGGGVKKVQIQF